MEVVNGAAGLRDFFFSTALTCADWPFSAARMAAWAASSGDVELVEFIALVVGQPGGEFGAAFVAVQVDGPVFLRDKGADFGFALTDQPQRRALHAAGGGQATADFFFPQQRRQIKATR